MHNDKTLLTADILVVGGGTSGCNAAIAAARERVSVLLIDMDDAVGGVATRANISGYHFGSRGGLQDEVDRRVMARQRVFGGRDSLSHPEAKRSVYSEMLRDYNVRVLLGHIAYEAIVEGGRVVGVKAAGSDGLKEIRAKVTIDCTSEGDVAASAGAAYTVGRPFDGVSHAYSLTPRILDDHPKTGKPQISLRNFDAGWVHSLSVEDISSAYMEGRAHLITFLTKGNGVGRHLISVAPKLGVREGRHIIGDYVMTLDDYLYDRRFEDVITRSCSHYDTHARDLGNESDFAQIWLAVLDMFKRGSLWCDVPYRSLLPKGISSLLVASRALSVDREVSMGVRMQRDIQKIGEAAGIAAACSAIKGVEPRELPIETLQQKLIEHGVLKPDDLTRTETTNLMLQEGTLGGIPISPESIRGLNEEQADVMAQQLADYVGTEEEGAAVWWLMQLGGPAKAPLLALLNGNQDHKVRRTAAFALGLLGSKEAEPFLLQVLRDREDERGPLARSLPKWVSAVVVLRLLNCRAALDDVVAALEETHSAGIHTFLLQFIYLASGELSEYERNALATRLKMWVSRPGIGDGYLTEKENAVISIRWNMVLWVGRILVKNGDRSGCNMCMTYMKDSRVYVRQAAAKALQELEQLPDTMIQKGGAAG